MGDHSPHQSVLVHVMQDRPGLLVQEYGQSVSWQSGPPVMHANTPHLIRLMDHPPVDYTPFPMWFWNDALDSEEIRRQIMDFHQHDVSGFVIHPRMGIPRSIPYMSEVFLDYVQCAVRTAAELGMQVILYDEGMYPSGSAHGQVAAANPDFAAQALVRQITGEAKSGGTEQCRMDNLAGSGHNSPGQLIHQRFCTDGSGQAVQITYCQVPSGGKIRGIHFGEDSNQPGAPLASDLLNPDAVSCFISLTHERYYRKLATFFGTTIKAFFTDEPSLLGRGPMEGKIPWTGDMLDVWLANGKSADDLEKLFPESPDFDPKIRRQFDALCRNRLDETYYLPLSRWCEAHGIALTGHPAQSDEIGLLRCFQIPGQDLVLRKVGPEDEKGLSGPDSTLAKCSADAARLASKPRNAVECLGCCVRENPSSGWDLPPDDMKWYLDWLAVRGVNLFIPHAFFYSLRGRRSGERPPDVGPAQTWWAEYSSWARYMTRLSCLMSHTATVLPVAVLCTDDFLPWNMVRPLYENQLDFNYLPVTTLHDGRARFANGKLRMGDYTYDTVLVEDPMLFDDDTSRMLAGFARAGLSVLWPSLSHDRLRPQQISNQNSQQLAVQKATEWSWLGHTGDTWIEELKARSAAVISGSGPLHNLRMTCQKRGDDQFILLVNEGNESLVFDLICRMTDREPVVWDPWSGLWGRPHRSAASPFSPVRLHMPYRQSLVVWYPSDQSTIRSYLSWRPDKDRQISCVDLTSGWKMAVPGRLKPRTVNLSSGSWHAMPRMGRFSGQAVYQRYFQLDWPDQGPVWLDLGTVHEAATVIVNGQKAGTRFWQPFRFDITHAVRYGVNRIDVIVMNNISCRMDGHPKQSGLLGPVHLEITQGGQHL